MATGILSAVPRWYEIAVVLRNRILNGSFAPGDKIPGETDLVEEFGVSRMTVRQALERLAGERLIIRRQGIGTMVSDDLQFGPLALTGYLEDLLLLFTQTQVVRVKIERVRTSGPIARFLQTSEKTCIRITRVRKRGSKMFSFSQSYLSNSIGSSVRAEELDKSLLFQVLESRLGIVLTEAFQTIGCRPAGRLIAEHLQLDPSAPVLSIELRYFAKIPRGSNLEPAGERSPIAVTNLAIRPDAHSYQVRLVRLKREKAPD